jgi:hypothetical protein
MIFGPILILAGAGVEYLFAMMAFESVWRASGHPELAGTSFLISLGLTIAALATLALIAIGYFASKQKQPPIWYFIISGILPGILLFAGWKLVRAGLASRS